MNFASTNKGIISVSLGILAVLSGSFIIGYPTFLNQLIALGLAFLLSLFATYFGVLARKGDAKILGLVGLVLGITGLVVFGLAILFAVTFLFLFRNFHE